MTDKELEKIVEKEDQYRIYCDWNDKVENCSLYGTIYCSLRCNYAMNNGFKQNEPPTR